MLVCKTPPRVHSPTQKNLIKFSLRPLFSRLAAHKTTHKHKNPEEKQTRTRRGRQRQRQQQDEQALYLPGFQIVHPSFHVGPPPPRAGDLPVPPIYKGLGFDKC